MIDTGEMRRKWWKFPPDDYEYDPRFVMYVTGRLFQDYLDKIIVYGDALETGNLPQEPTTPIDNAASAGGQESDTKGTH